jgi:hypothetical protein
MPFSTASSELVPRFSRGSRLLRSIQPVILPVAGSMRAMTSVPQTFAYNSPSTISSSFSESIGLPSAVTCTRRTSFKLVGSSTRMLALPSLM